MTVGEVKKILSKFDDNNHVFVVVPTLECGAGLMKSISNIDRCFDMDTNECSINISILSDEAFMIRKDGL